MPRTPLHIIAACSIRNGLVWKNDQALALPVADDTSALLQGLYQYLSPAYPKWYKMDRLSQLGVLAVELLLRDLPASRPDPFQQAIVLQSRHGCLDTDLRFVQQLGEIPSPAVFVYTLPNIVIGEISIKFGIKGEQAMFMSTEPEPETLVRYTESLFAEGHTQFCITGWLNLFGKEASADIVVVSASSHGSLKNFSKENLYQYFHHE